MIVEIPQHEYLALDRASAHKLWAILDSPLHMRWQADHPKTPSNGMQQGSVFHALMAEEPIVVQPASANRKSNEGRSNLVTWLECVTNHEAPRPPTELKSASAKLEHQILALEAILQTSNIPVATQTQYETAQRMRESLLSKNIVKVLFDTGRAEQSCLQVDPQTGLLLKARFDWLPDNYRVIVDWKTTRSTRDFATDTVRFGYRASLLHLQAAFYSWIYELEFEEHPIFYFIVVENEPPHDSAIFEADESMLENGRNLFRIALDRYAECERTQTWPGRDWDWNAHEHTIRKLSLSR